MTVPFVRIGDIAPARPLKPSDFQSRDQVWLLNLDKVVSGSSALPEKVRGSAAKAGNSTHGFDKRHVLYSKLRPNLNKVVLPDETGMATTELVPLSPDPTRCDRSYLAHYLRSPRFVEWATSRTAGAKMPRVNMNEFRAHELPLPPLPEQRRIAAILDKADALRAKRREAIAKLDQLLQSVFLDMFGDPVTNPAGWPDEVCLGDMTSICSGITKGRRTTEPVRQVPYLAVANVQDRHLRLGTIKAIEATQVEIDRYRLAVNDLLLTEGGDPDKLGRGALWDGSIADCIHQNHVFRVRITSDLLSPVYLNWLVGSARGKRYFLGVAKQTTGIASINMTQLKKFPLLLPPFEMQVRFSEMVSTIEKHQRQLIRSQEESNFLFRSLQHQAFTGKL